jgi:hypothetical protein
MKRELIIKAGKPVYHYHPPVLLGEHEEPSDALLFSLGIASWVIKAKVKTKWRGRPVWRVEVLSDREYDRAEKSRDVLHESVRRPALSEHILLR